MLTATAVAQCAERPVLTLQEHLSFADICLTALTSRLLTGCASMAPQNMTIALPIGSDSQCNMQVVSFYPQLQ